MINSEEFDSRVLAQLRQPRSRTAREVAPELREAVRSVVSRSMREAEDSIATQVRSSRAFAAPGTPPIDSAVEDILVAYQMARVDLGVELMLAQPNAVAV